MSKTHYWPVLIVYDPYNEDRSDHGYCGTPIPEKGDFNNNPDYVSCKKCLKLLNKEQITKGGKG